MPDWISFFTITSFVTVRTSGKSLPDTSIRFSFVSPSCAGMLNSKLNPVASEIAPCTDFGSVFQVAGGFQKSMLENHTA
ncbi:hypothetical protein D3C75_1145360 [compost metagenome]